jgi:hypothetical protein
MAVSTVAILSFFIGGFIKWDSSLLAQNWSSSQTEIGFWVLFAIFFILFKREISGEVGSFANNPNI